MSKSEDIAQQQPQQAHEDEILPSIEYALRLAFADSSQDEPVEGDGQDEENRQDGAAREPDSNASPHHRSRDSSTPTGPDHLAIPDGHPTYGLRFPRALDNYPDYRRWIGRMHRNRLFVQHTLHLLSHRRLAIDYMVSRGEVSDEDIERLNEETNEVDGVYKCLLNDPLMLKSGKTWKHVIECHNQRVALQRRLQDHTDSGIQDDPQVNGGEESEGGEES